MLRSRSLDELVCLPQHEVQDIGDRTVGGLCSRDQLVGPWQVPVSDVAVTASSYEGYTGEAFAMGERTPVAIHDGPASARLAVAEAVDLDIVLYNIPGRTGSNITPETMARLAELPTIVAVKEATGSMDQASAIAALCDLTLLSGDDSLTLPLLSIGGRGVVSVIANIVPRDTADMVHAALDGD